MYLAIEWLKRRRSHRLLRRSLVKSIVALLALLIPLGNARAADLTKVPIALTSASIAASGVRIAKEMGLFAQHGIDAQISIMDSGSLAMLGLLSNSVTFNSDGITDVVIAQGQGQDIVSIAPIYHGFGGSLVLAKSVADKLGVSAASPLDAKLKALDGLLIGSPSGSSPYTITLNMVANLVGAKVRLSYMAQPAMVAALRTGAIQGMMVGAPYYAQAELDGTGVTLLSGPKGEFPKGTTPSYAVALNARRDYALANPDLVARMRAVLADLSRATTERPADVRAALGRLFPDLDAKTMDVIFATESHGFVTAPLTPADIQQDITYLRGNGIKFSQPDRVTPENILFK